MWALVESNNVTQVYTRPKQLTLGDVNYPSNIFTMWTNSELEAIGVYVVVEDNTNYKDPAYYNNTDQSFKFASNKVTATYGTAKAIPLDDSGSGADLVRGLKYQHLKAIDNAAYGLLQPNDWMVVRNAESSKAIPSDWLDYRVAVRTAAGNARTAIDAVSTVDELAALTITWPTQPTS